jgi:hypothetical protein
LPDKYFILPSDNSRIAAIASVAFRNPDISMYRLLIIAFVALLAGQQAVHAQTAVQPGLAPTTTENDGALPYVVALGAIAGIVVFNVAALGIEALPGGMAYASGATVPAEMSVAMSRVYAGASAVIGGLIADYIYTSR